jgi:hypothetical protein
MAICGSHWRNTNLSNYIIGYWLAIPESGNIKPWPLKIKSIRVIISCRNFFSHGGVDALRKDGKKKIHEEHILSFFEGSVMSFFGKYSICPRRKEVNP